MCSSKQKGIKTEVVKTMYLKSPGKIVAGWKRTSEKEFDIRLNLNLDTLLYSVRMGNRSDQVVSSWPSYLPDLN